MRFHERDAVQIENEEIRLTVLREGGHIAEILDKKSGVSPLWIPQWKSMEPSQYNPATHPEYGSNIESRLLAGLMGHNLCLGLFGPPSHEEAAAGVGVHGEASVAHYTIERNNNRLQGDAMLPLFELKLTRILELNPSKPVIEITETVENLSALDRPIAWTQHVTLGSPFVQHGVTQFAIPAKRSRVFEGDFGDTALVPGADFTWPLAPAQNNGIIDLQTFSNAAKSAGFTTHLMDPDRSFAFFAAYNPQLKLLFGCRWKQTDFPWLGLWEENRSRRTLPWNGETVALGMEFGASPFPEPRQQMIERNRLFDVPAYRWLPARSSITAGYTFSLQQFEAALETFDPEDFFDFG